MELRDKEGAMVPRAGAVCDILSDMVPVSKMLKGSALKSS